MFPNKGCTGKTDMVLEIDGQFVPIDVKVQRWRKDRGCWGSAGTASAKGVYLVLVNPETEGIRWQYRSNSHVPVCPPGLEDFWS